MFPHVYSPCSGSRHGMIQSMIPFAVVGSERTVIIDGKPVRGRKNRWGVINVEDERHCEFVYLRNFLTRSVCVPVFPCVRFLLVCSCRMYAHIGHTSRTSSRPRRRSTTRPSGQNSSSRSRSRPTRVRRPLRSKRTQSSAKPSASSCRDLRLVRGCDTPQLEFPFARSDCYRPLRTLVVKDGTSYPDLAPNPTSTFWSWMLVVAVTTVAPRIVASYCVVSYCLCASTLVYNSIPFLLICPTCVQAQDVARSPRTRSVSISPESVWYVCTIVSWLLCACANV